MPPPPPPPPPQAQAHHPNTLHTPSFPSSSLRSGSTSPSPATQTQTQTETTATLRLRGAHDPSEQTMRRRRGPAIRWAEDVIDNEGLGRKRSKVCCIYHKPRAVGESSSSEDSSSSSDSDSGDSSGIDDDGAARMAGGGGKKGRRRGYRHHDHERGEGRRRRPSPNAYERMPKVRTKAKTSTGTEGKAGKEVQTEGAR